MLSQKHLPITILSLAILSSLAILLVGWKFAKAETRAVVERDQEGLISFAASFLEEVQEFENLYLKHLDDIRQRFLHSGNQIQFTNACRNVVGVEQVSLYRKNSKVFCIDLRDTDRSVSLPQPRLVGGNNSRNIEGILINPGHVPDFGDWLDTPGHPPHYVTRLNYDRILVLRINTESIAGAMDDSLQEWLVEMFEPVDVSGINAVVISPLGTKLAVSGEPKQGKPSLLLPVPCSLGRWNIAAWDDYETVVTYRTQVLIGAVALALFLILFGLFGFIQLRRAFQLAEQRVSFVNRVSHELRTPLTNILLNLDLLADSIVEKNPRTEKNLGLIREETNRLSRLLSNVLTFSRNKRNPPACVSCDMKQLANEVVDQFLPLLKRKGMKPEFRFEPQTSVYALGDPDAIRQIIGNLISNIEKYGPANQVFEISIARRGGEVVLAVTDHGPGIKPSRLAQIFMPFERLDDSTTEGVSGTGLGLTIARDLAESMGGTLVVQSTVAEPGHGSRFELVLPGSEANIVPIAS